VEHERRQYDRRPLRVNAVARTALQPIFAARTIDISLGGMGIVAEVNPAAGAVFDIEFALPLRPRGHFPMRLGVRVVRAVFASSEGGFKIGLVFTEISPQTAQAIVSYMRV
jgi:c-di-GMP-binding flagellar brake protein YcgR